MSGPLPAGAAMLKLVCTSPKPIVWIRNGMLCFAEKALSAASMIGARSVLIQIVSEPSVEGRGVGAIVGVAVGSSAVTVLKLIAVNVIRMHRVRTRLVLKTGFIDNSP